MPPAPEPQPLSRWEELKGVITPVERLITVTLKDLRSKQLQILENRECEVLRRWSPGKRLFLAVSGGSLTHLTDACNIGDRL